MLIYAKKINSESAKLSIELDGKVYSETWRKEEDGNYSISSPLIVDQLIMNKVEHEEELIDYIKGVDMGKFVELCNMY